MSVSPGGAESSSAGGVDFLDQYCVKMVDFGVSKVEVEASKSNTMIAFGIGTAVYRAPEVHPKANSKGLGKKNRKKKKFGSKGT